LKKAVHSNPTNLEMGIVKIKNGRSDKARETDIIYDVFPNSEEFQTD
jgi:ABC-type branched-subunit amino acid transport system ATPase component